MSTAITLLFLSLLPLISAFDREICLQTITDKLNNRTLLSNSSLFFREAPTSPLYNPFYNNVNTNATLTLAGCNALCGPQQTFYEDVVPRLLTWVTPLLLLIANADLSPLNQRNLYAVLHLLGDPIDSLWSLLHKLDAWDTCYRRAGQYNDVCPSCQRIIASVLALYEEVHGSTIVPDRDFDRLLRDPSQILFFNEWRRLAVRVADSRNEQLMRTLLALTVYIFGLVASFVPEVGGAGSSPPGGRIATSVLLSWLIPLILLTNLIGSLSSRRTAYKILADFAANTQYEHLFELGDRHSIFRGNHPTAYKERITEYFDALAWSGSIYTYRPWKLRYVVSKPYRKTHTFYLAALATAPILIALAGSVLILWYQLPIGLNCRHPWLISVGIAWIWSAIFTSCTYTPSIATGVYHWRLTLIKDACVAIPSLAAMVLSVIGMYNSCYCWSGPLHYGDQAHVPLMSAVYWTTTGTIYPIIVSTVLGLEVLVVLVVAVKWRRGLTLLRWDEKTLAAEWERVWNCAPCGASNTVCRNGVPDELDPRRKRDAKYFESVAVVSVPVYS